MTMRRRVATGRAVAALRRARSETGAGGGGDGDVSAEQCEMCARPAGQHHPHVVDLESRELLCTCRPCSYLFVAEGAAAGRYRAVPERYLSFGDFTLDQARWDALQIPVGMAFFFTNSRLGRTVAFYPGPAGATESELPLEAWQEVVDDNPALGGAAPDVEAILVAAPGARSPMASGHDDRFACFLVPIDTCYELVGHLRSTWRGFDGGQEVRDRLETFFADLRRRSRPAPPAHSHRGSA